MTRTRSPARSADPSTRLATPSSRAITDGRGRRSRYGDTALRAITLSASIFPSCVVISSVIPSAKYCCAGGPRLSRGRTATDGITPPVPSGVEAG